MVKPIQDATPKLWNLYKKSIQAIKYRKPYQTAFLILGCQRSGTSLITYVLNQLPTTRVYGEFSVLSQRGKDKIRLDSLNNVNAIISTVSAPLVVMKPLVESQNALTLLNGIPNSYIIWVYRNYKDVALSDIKKFSPSNAISNLRPIIKGNKDDWRAENCSDETREIISRYFDESMNPLDAACLFWYSRNILFFEQNLEQVEKVTVWKYEQFVKEPKYLVNALLAKNEQPDISDKAINSVFKDSVGSAKGENVNPEIEALCDSLYQKLEEISSLNYK